MSEFGNGFLVGCLLCGGAALLLWGMWRAERLKAKALEGIARAEKPPEFNGAPRLTMWDRMSEEEKRRRSGGS